MSMQQQTIPTAAPVQIVADNPRRKTLSINNYGANPMYIKNGNSAVTTTGYYLGAGTAVDFAEVDGDEPRLALYGQATGGATTISVHEGFGKIAGE